MDKFYFDWNCDVFGKCNEFSRKINISPNVGELVGKLWEKFSSALFNRIIWGVLFVDFAQASYNYLQYKACSDLLNISKVSGHVVHNGYKIW